MTVTLDPWLGMAFGMQALRQIATRDEASLLGALGVGAEPLPHQVETVLRILTAPEIRHLIADEVGLGKTVQSLMIVNALRLADPGHRTLVMAPDILLEQWAAEFSTRCNISPVRPEEGETDADHDTAPVWLVRPERLLEPGFLDWASGHFDLLIVDEPQTLTQAQHDALASKRRDALLTRRFVSVLLLSATPGFGNPRMRRQILRLIEPDRADAALLGEDAVAAMIAEDEGGARHALMAGDGDPATHWAAQSLERRICRWTRLDWPEITPERVVRRLSVAPFDGEATLAGTATRLLGRPVEDAAGRLQLTQRAQRLHRRGDPARNAMRDLNLPYPAEEGDTRFDALLDRLLAIWEDDPEARVVVVVGDTPTIDRLTPRLQRYFPEAGPVAQVRRSQNIKSEDEAIAASFDQIDGYRTGASRLLLIGDWAGAGLNLHYGTREIVFYACPWTMREVDQLTGRLDRLAKGAERHIRTKKRRREIGVSVIAWQGSPEARVIEGLARLGVFERPRAPVSEETQAGIDDDLHACATGEGHTAAFERLSSLAAENLFDLSDPVLAHANPHRRDRAEALYERLEAAAVPGALPSSDPETGGARVPAENALEGWMQAMRAAGTFRLSLREDERDPNLRGRFLWYPDTLAKGDVTRPVALPLLETASRRDYPNYDEGAVAFVSRRRHLVAPPALQIEPEHLAERALRFLDHGNEFLGQLCGTLAAHGRAAQDDAAPPVVAVIYPPGHPFAGEEAAPMMIACALEHAEARALSANERAAVVEGCTHERDSRAVLRRLHAGLAADARWMRWQRPARFALAGLFLDPDTGTWMPLPEDACTAALDPRGEDGTAGQCHAPTMVERRRIPASAGGKVAAYLGTALPAPAPAALAARKALIEAHLAHEVRTLTLRKARDVEMANLPNVARGLDQRYDARIAATRRAARMRCLLLDKGWKTVRETRHLGIHPRPRRDA